MIDFFAGLLISALAGMGIGGGGLLVLYLVFVKDMPQLEAQGMNLVFFIFASASALLYHIRKRKINWKLTVLLAAVGVLGAYFGVKTAAVASPKIIRKVFGWLLITSGALVLLGKKRGKDNGAENKNNFFKKGVDRM